MKSLIGSILSDVFVKPRRLVQGLVQPKKVVVYLCNLRLQKRLQRMMKTAPEFFHGITGQNQLQLDAYIRELTQSSFYHTLGENVQRLNMEAKAQSKEVRLSSGHLTAHGSQEPGILLYGIVRAKKPKIVVETGVANGESSALILYALEVNGGGATL